MIRPQPERKFEISASTWALSALGNEGARTGNACAGASLGEQKTLALRIKRRKTVSVTPAMGARTVAGATRTPPIRTSEGTNALSGMAWGSGLSQDLRISLILAARGGRRGIDRSPGARRRSQPAAVQRHQKSPRQARAFWHVISIFRSLIFDP